MKTEIVYCDQIPEGINFYSEGILVIGTKKE